MSKISIMIFSDFHCKLFAVDSNPSLISSIKSDSQRYPNENPSITAPELLIVCGDIIQGTENFNDFDAGISEISDQYARAEHNMYGTANF